MTYTDDWFERYRFCQPIGQGGMGIIYLAEDRTSNRQQCVIKQLINRTTDKQEQAESIRLFAREAAVLRGLHHPGIVRVRDDHATADGKYFLVMDYIPGRNLDAIVQHYGPFDSEAAVEIAIQCTEVLEYLHAQDPPIIYRDLKPSNLMLTPDGRIIFIDFGIARAFLPADAATRVVSAGYSPPEQYAGKPEVKSDLYALGATLGHLLTGLHPKPLSVSNPRSIVLEILPSFNKLIGDLTTQNAADRPASARHCRYELYKIYKEIHPEFEIPKAALQAQEAAANQAPGDSRKMAPSEQTLWPRDTLTEQELPRRTQTRLKTLKQPEAPLTKEETVRLDPLGRPLRQRNEKTSFLDRLRQWITIKMQ